MYSLATKLLRQSALPQTRTAVRAFSQAAETDMDASIKKRGQKNAWVHWEIEDRTGINFSIVNRPGVLKQVLRIFTDNNIDMTYISSKPNKFISSGERKTEFSIDFMGTAEDDHTKSLIKDLEAINACVMVTGTPEVPFFPKSILDLDQIGSRILGAGDGIQDVDHPQFKDPVYCKRRNEIAEAAFNYSMAHEKLPEIEYTDEEKGVWKLCYEKLMPMMEKNANYECMYTLGEMEKHCGFRADNIPQLGDISNYIESKTKWRLKPVAGLLTGREFLNGLAFRVFHST